MTVSVAHWLKILANSSITVRGYIVMMTLVIPIYDENKSLVNLQMIQPDRIKRFLSGGRKNGCFAVIGKMGVDGII